jgi:hypothetical protein
VRVFEFYAYVFGPAAVGLLLGGILALLARRIKVTEVGAARVVHGAAAAVVLALQLFALRWFAWPWSIPDWVLGDHSVLRLGMLVIPLALGILLVAPTAWGPRPRIGGVAPLARRGILTLVRPWMIVTLGLLLAAAVALALAGGAVSSPGDDGRYTMFFVEVARETGAGTTIYGWFFSVRALSVVCGLVVTAVIALALLARRPLGTEPDVELARRRSRARGVLAAAGGALLLHLAEVLGMFAATASLTASFSAGNLGMIEIVGPFAALGPALRAGAQIAAALGYALWWFLLLTAALPGRRTARTP